LLRRKGMRKRSRAGQSGFTLIEVMIVALLALILVSFGVPALQQLLLRSKLEAVAQQIEATLRKARYDAIREGNPIVVQALPADGVLRSYTDVPTLDVNGNRTDTVLGFEPVVGAPKGTTDREISTLALPSYVEFSAPTGLEVVDGLTNISGGPVGDAEVSELVAVFRADGSLQDIGALRAGDTRGNFFEFRVEIAATGKVILRKYDCALDVWYERFYLNETTNLREVTSRWKWYSGFSGGC